MERRIAFEKIANARDLGGLQTEDGRRVVPGLLIRCAAPVQVSAADEKILRERYRLAKIIDLRTEMERREKPDAVMEGVTYLPNPVFDESTTGISHEAGADEAQIGALLPNMEELYRRMVTEETCRRNLGRAARQVMEHDFEQGGVLWHCTEGKDRCGLLSAVLLLALRVGRGEILEDYLLTNEANGPKAERYYAQMLAAGKAEAEAALVRDVFLAQARYLDAAFAVIDGQYPDGTAFLREGLGIPAAAAERFRESVLR